MANIQFEGGCACMVRKAGKIAGFTEAVDVGTVLLVGTDTNKIIEQTNKLLNNEESYKSMSMLHNPYGDGTACEKIVKFIANL